MMSTRLPLVVFLVVFLVVLATLAGGALMLALLLTPVGRTPMAVTAVTAVTAVAVTPAPGAPTASASPAPAGSPAATQPPRPTLTPADHEAAAKLLYAEGARNQSEGDLELAVSRFAEVVSLHPNASPAAEAGLRLGECYLALGSNSLALEALKGAIARTPVGGPPGAAFVLAGDAAKALGDLSAAAEFYDRYARAGTPSAGYVSLRLGDTYLALGRLDAALAAYQRAADAGLPASPTVDALDRMATVYVQQKDYAGAIARYLAILDLARTNSYRAYILRRMGTAYAAAGLPDKAGAAWLQVVTSYPETAEALPCLKLLDAQGLVPVDTYQRAWVHFNAGSYSEAIAGWRRYVADAPKGDGTGWARYYIGRSIQAQGDHAAALSEYDTLIRLYASGPAVTEGRVARARVMRLQGNEKAAASAFLSAARALPGTTQAQLAFWDAGLSLYRTGDAAGAVAAWQELPPGYPSSAYRVRSQFWTGKALLGLGRASEGRKLLTDAAGENPPSHYALRAADLLGAPTAATPSISTTKAITSTNWAEVVAAIRPAAEKWVSEWVPATASPYDTRAARVSANPNLKRALELIGLHMATDAAEEFRLANGTLAAAKDPWALLEMALRLNELGLYQQAVSSATALLGQSPAGWAGAAPESVQRLLYPYPYRSLFEASAKQYSVDPLVMASLARQESLFAAGAISRSDAKGLTQVIPATAREIAAALARKDFRQEDLFRPRLSLDFGSYYLSQMLKLTKGNVWMALASYNGGYTNALRWAGGQTTTDQDVFLENITYNESQVYVQAVSRNLRFYRTLYGP